MRFFAAPRNPAMFPPISPLWQRVSSLGALFAAVGLFALSVLLSPNHGHLIKALLPAVFVAMAFAVFLSAYSFWNLRAQHHSSDRAFRNADCEFLSIFQNALDGILILDSEGTCLDANPSAAAILRFPADKLIGES